MYHLFHMHLRRSGIEAFLLQGVLWVIVVQCMYVVKAKIPRGHLGGGGSCSSHSSVVVFDWLFYSCENVGIAAPKRQADGGIGWPVQVRN